MPPSLEERLAGPVLASILLNHTRQLQHETVNLSGAVAPRCTLAHSEGTALPSEQVRGQELELPWNLQGGCGHHRGSHKASHAVNCDTSPRAYISPQLNGRG